MSSRPAGDHPGAERLVDLLHGQLSEDEARTVEEHLADCDFCVEMARTVRTVSRMVDEWTASDHGAAARQAELARSVLQEADRAATPQLRERLLGWARLRTGQAAAALRLVFEAPGQVRFITQGLERVILPGGFGSFGAPLLAGAGGAVRLRGAVRTRGTTGASGGGPQGSAAVAIETSGESPARVAVTGDVLDIHVRRWPEGREPPLVMLVRCGEGGAPRVAPLVRVPGTADLTARFDRMGPGEYLVAIEPMDAPSATSDGSSPSESHG